MNSESEVNQTVCYDPRLIQSYAKWLKRRSFIALFFWPLIGFGIAYLLTGFNSFYYPSVIWVVGIVLGYLLGAYRSICMRLKAQESLCLMKIEANTRQ